MLELFIVLSILRENDKFSAVLSPKHWLNIAPSLGRESVEISLKCDNN